VDCEGAGEYRDGALLSGVTERGRCSNWAPRLEKRVSVDVDRGCIPGAGDVDLSRVSASCWLRPCRCFAPRCSGPDRE